MTSSEKSSRGWHIVIFRADQSKKPPCRLKSEMSGGRADKCRPPLKYRIFSVAVRFWYIEKHAIFAIYCDILWYITLFRCDIVWCVEQLAIPRGFESAGLMQTMKAEPPPTKFLKKGGCRRFFNGHQSSIKSLCTSCIFNKSILLCRCTQSLSWSYLLL